MAHTRYPRKAGKSAVTPEMLVAPAEQVSRDRSLASQRDWPGAAASLKGHAGAATAPRPSAVSKQAAAQTITVLQARGYVARAVDPNDARRKRLQVTHHGFNMLRESEVIFDKLRAQWAKQIGAAKLKDIEAHLAELTGPAPLRFDTPGWFARGLGRPA